MKTYYFDDGKYQVDRNDEGVMTDMRRGGEHWNAGYSSFQFSKLFHAMLNRIDERDARIAELEKQTEPVAEVTLDYPKWGVKWLVHPKDLGSGVKLFAVVSATPLPEDPVAKKPSVHIKSYVR